MLSFSQVPEVSLLGILKGRLKPGSQFPSRLVALFAIHYTMAPEPVRMIMLALKNSMVLDTLILASSRLR